MRQNGYYCVKLLAIPARLRGSAPSLPCHPGPPPHFLVSMLMRLYTAGKLLASRQPNIGCTSCVLWLPSSKLISLKGEMRTRALRGQRRQAKKYGMKPQRPVQSSWNIESLSICILCLSSFYAVVHSHRAAGAQFYAASRSGAQPLCSHCAVSVQLCAMVRCH